MEKFKFLLFSVITLSLLGLLGYWSVMTLQSGTEYKTSKKVQQLEKENGDLKTEVKSLADELSILHAKLAQFTPSESQSPEPEKVVYKYQSLIDDLQKLINNKIFLKLKSIGPNVGIVQKFLNIYNNTSNKVDNDYGASTKTAVSAFQKKEGLTADGETGPGTFSKMIDWLKKQT